MMGIRAYDCPGGYVFRVHLDTSKALPDGAPDPAFVTEYTWAKTPPPGQTVAEYLRNCKREARLLAEWELERRKPAREIELPVVAERGQV